MPGCGSKGNSDVENKREGQLAIGGEGVSVVIGRGINSDSGWGGPVAPPMFWFSFLKSVTIHTLFPSPLGTGNALLAHWLCSVPQGTICPASKHAFSSVSYIS